MWKRVPSDICVYCGVLASETEHFPPKSTLSSGFLLTACRECNGTARDLYPYDFEARADFVKSQLKDALALKLEKHQVGSTEWFSVTDNERVRILWNAKLHLIEIAPDIFTFDWQSKADYETSGARSCYNLHSKPITNEIPAYVSKGRRRSYPWKSMRPGDNFYVPLTNRKQFSHNLWYARKITDFKFSMKEEGDGVRIARVS